MQLEAVGCLTLRYQEKMQMRKQRQRTGEQRSVQMVRRTCLNGKKGVLKKQRGGVLNIKKQNHLFFLFLPKAVFEHVHISSDPQNCLHVLQPSSGSVCSMHPLLQARTSYHIASWRVLYLLLLSKCWHRVFGLERIERERRDMP